MSPFAKICAPAPARGHVLPREAGANRKAALVLVPVARCPRIPSPERRRPTSSQRVPRSAACPCPAEPTKGRLRHAPAGRWPRYSYSAGAVGPQGGPERADLHARSEPRRAWRGQTRRWHYAPNPGRTGRDFLSPHKSTGRRENSWLQLPLRRETLGSTGRKRAFERCYAENYLTPTFGNEVRPEFKSERTSNQQK